MNHMSSFRPPRRAFFCFIAPHRLNPSLLPRNRAGQCPLDAAANIDTTNGLLRDLGKR